MSFLQLEGKKIVIFGVANRKSVAFHIAKVLKDEGAELIFSVQGEDQQKTINKFFPGSSTYFCDVSSEDGLKTTAKQIGDDHGTVYGVVHSIAFANYSEGLKPFHETRKKDFLQAVDISCFSFISMADCFKSILDPDGSMITISISTTKMAAESYGYMAPIKAALDSSVCFLAKSLSNDSRIRVNAVGAAPLKTSSSAGIPGYIEPICSQKKPPCVMKR